MPSAHIMVWSCVGAAKQARVVTCHAQCNAGNEDTHLQAGHSSLPLHSCTAAESIPPVTLMHKDKQTCYRNAALP